MKKAVVILVVFLFFLLILAGILFKIFKTSDTPAEQQPTVQFPSATESAGATAQDPEQFVRSFYIWYLENFSRDPEFPHPENRDEVLSPWLSSELLASWDEIVIEDEVNPVLLTADDPASWGADLTVQTIGQSIRTRTLRVTLGSGDSQHVYSVELAKQQDSSWRISSVASSI
jgi:hypothetical protein